MKTLGEILGESPVFAGLAGDRLELIAGCARNVAIGEGERLFREGGAADTFFVIRRGRVAITIDEAGRGGLAIDTVEPGDVVGWSWLFEPYRWHFDAVAVEDVGALAIDGACLRGKCAEDPALGYELMRRLAGVLIERLQATRLRLLDVYGSAVGG